MSQFWTILDGDGVVIRPLVITGGADQSPADAGEPMEAGWQAVAIDIAPDPAINVWRGGAWQVDLSSVKAAAATKVSDDAEALRARFLTPGAGQAMTYVRKEAEARAWTDGADEAAFPFLNAEATACGMTVADLAATVIAQADAWVRIGSAIEALRRGAFVAIGEAGTIEAIETAAAVDWSVIA